MLNSNLMQEFGSTTPTGPTKPAGTTPGDAKETKPAAAEAGGRSSVIGNDLQIRGENLEIRSDGKLRIEGAISGNVVAAELEVGPDGRVDGQVSAGRVSIEGTVDGAIDADQVDLRHSANVSGDIHHDLLAVESGANFNGKAINRRRADRAGSEQR